ncbi:hypothetical protein C4K68_23570 [Pokkaliibacter plantistimulans]|uniref:Glycosyl transferase family 1 n=1 Tax=Proteobacteria bacterium 228 TaxID=2083153 RepID=A0A2S5KJF8_9PROT|nr:glycosyltransferase [Pokkaliibacter plantistimulans]PPC74954.1 hypothetical protein C4K68_23570 [Pokkaliibacter plantistimulans]
MNIDIVTPSVTTNSGGVGSALISLYQNVERFSEPGVNITVHSLSDHGEDYKKIKNTKIQYLTYPSYPPKSIGLSKELIHSLAKSSTNLIHLHGIWMMTSIAPLLAKKIRNTPYIISPHGMMDPWITSKSKIKKHLAMSFYERSSWKNANIFHALNKNEYESIKKLCPSANIRVIPNGINIPEYEKLNSRINDVKQILFLGRLHEKKNLHTLVSAIGNIDDKTYERNPFILNIVGWGDKKYENFVKNLSQKSPNRFNFIGPLYNEEKEVLLKNSDAFILPSFSEGLPMSVLEALSYGVPNLINKNCNIDNIFKEDVAFNIGTNEEEIQNGIIEFVKLNNSEVEKVRFKSLEFVKKNYSWEVVAPQYISMYKELL